MEERKWGAWGKRKIDTGLYSGFGRVTEELSNSRGNTEFIPEFV